MSVQLPFAIGPDGRLISIADAERGLACGCFCPECNCRLVAKKGDELAPHFAHEADANCAGAVESMLHRLAKQTIADAKLVYFPPVEARFRGAKRYLAGGGVFEAVTVELERRAGPIQPDAVLTHANSTQLAVEVLVTHAVTPEKAAVYADSGLACIEIDLSEHHGPHRLRTAPDHLPDIILRSAPRSWVYSPKIAAALAEMQAAQEARRAEELRRAHIVEAARQAMEAARRSRLTAEQREQEEQRRVDAALVAEQRRADAALVAEQRRVDEASMAVRRAKAEAEGRQRAAEVAAHSAAVAHYRAAERAEATRWEDHPRQWRFGLQFLARKFLTQNAAEAWLAAPLEVAQGHSVDAWPFDQLPSRTELNAIYAALWAQIKQEGRYHGP